MNKFKNQTRSVLAVSAYAAAALVTAVAVPVARAQTPSPLPEWYYSQGHLLESHVRKEEAPEWSTIVGISAETQPKYSGGNAYTTSGGPSFDVRYYDLAFASSGEGLGVNLLHDKNYRAGIALDYDLGREARVDHHLYGMGNISPAPEAKLFAEYLLFPVTFRVAGRYTFGGQGGLIGDVSIYSPLAGSKKFFVFAGPTFTFADADNQRHNFGISAKQAETSGYPQYHASGGFRSMSFGLSGGYFVTQHWLLTGMAAARDLVGPAGHSPFVQEQGQYALALTAAYEW